MSNAALPLSSQPNSPAVQRIGLVVTIALAFWLAFVFLLGASEVFVTPRGKPPLPLLIGAIAPIVVFYALCRVSSSFREFVLTADLRLLIGIQAWRFAGFAFIALYTHGILPGLFALPAGLGDMAIGITAPWILVALIRQRAFAQSKVFIAWNVLGIMDLVVAISIGAIGPRLIGGVISSVPTASMSQLPLVLIPTYLVPAFVILHISALYQARRRA